MSRFTIVSADEFVPIKQTMNAFNPDQPRDEHGRWLGDVNDYLDHQLQGLKGPQKAKLFKKHGGYDSWRENVVKEYKEKEQGAKVSSQSNKDIIEQHGHLPQYSQEWQQKVADPIMAKIEKAPVDYAANAAISSAMTTLSSSFSGLVNIARLHEEVNASSHKIDKDSFLHTLHEGTKSGKYELHPYTGSRNAMTDHDYVIPTGKELMQFVRRLS